MIMSLLRGFIFTLVYLIMLSNIFGLTGVWMTLPLAELSTIIVSAIAFINVKKIMRYSIKRN